MAVAMSKKRMVKTVPKGTSNYQAAWIVDEDERVCDEDVEEIDDESEQEEDMDKEMAHESNSLRQSEDISEAEKDSEMDFEQIDVSEDTEAYDTRIKEQDEAIAYVLNFNFVRHCCQIVYSITFAFL